MELALAAIPILIALIIGFIKIRAAWNGSNKPEPVEVEDAKQNPALNPTRDDVLRDLGLLGTAPAEGLGSGNSESGEAVTDTEAPPGSSEPT